jgi:hypothetical protein
MEKKNIKPKKINHTKPRPAFLPESTEINDLEVAKKMLKIYQSAADRKLEFNLSFESVKKLLSYQTCYYTNKKFEEEGNFSRSFDRVDSAKGYIEGNVVACTVDINGKKSNLSFEEIECIYKKISPFKEKSQKPERNEKSSEVVDVQITPQEEPVEGYIENAEAPTEI